VRLPGTFRQLLAQVKASPVPIGSISVPTKDGPLTLTFGDAPAKAPEKTLAQQSKPLRERDTIGAFKTPPLGHEEPFTPLADS
jgi:hypothetical protein